MSCLWIGTRISGGGPRCRSSVSCMTPMMDWIPNSIQAVSSVTPVQTIVLTLCTSGVLTRIAGGLQKGFSGDGGLVGAALLDSPKGLAVDGSGNLYIADSNNHRVRKVSPSGIVTTVAGNG